MNGRAGKRRMVCSHMPLFTPTHKKYPSSFAFSLNKKNHEEKVFRLSPAPLILFEPLSVFIHAYLFLRIRISNFWVACSVACRHTQQYGRKTRIMLIFRPPPLPALPLHSPPPSPKACSLGLNLEQTMCVQNVRLWEGGSCLAFVWIWPVKGLKACNC